jgi:flagellar basal-body rod protein FlgG
MANISGIFNYLTAMSSNEGYQVLSANLPQSVNNMVKESGVNNDIATFEKGVASTKTVSDFVSNPNLVNFVLTAFGLDSVESEQGLIKQVLTQDPNNANSLVNQLSDPRFKAMATALDFYDDGLSGLKATGLTAPTAATSAEGISLATGSNGTASTASTSTTTSTPAPLTIGLSVNGTGYLQLGKTDGTTVYAQSAFFTVNSQDQLALPDGTELEPALSIPTGATSLQTDAQGNLYAQVSGQAQLVGQLLLTKFPNPSALQTDSSTGYSTATDAAGVAQLGIATDTKIGLGSVQSYVGNTAQTVVNNYVTNEFEESVGDSNSAVREALYFQRNIAGETNATGTSADVTNAYAILGDSVTRDVFLTAIDQPASIAEQALSTQVGLVDDGLNGVNFQDPAQVAKFTQRYLTTIDASGESTKPTTTSTSAAVQLLTAYAGSSSSSSSAGESILKLAV